jgi:hypothetical protein
MRHLAGFDSLSPQIRVSLMTLAGKLEYLYSGRDSDRKLIAKKVDEVLDLNQILVDNHVGPRWLEAADLVARATVAKQKTA